MAMQFPSSPNTGDTHQINGVTYYYTGEAWSSSWATRFTSTKRIIAQTSAPTTGLECGTLWFDTTSNILKSYNCVVSQWEVVEAVAYGDPIYVLTASSATINEGGTLTFFVNTTNVPDGTLHSYTISGINSADVTSGALTGSINIQGGQASVTIVLSEDATTEGPETAIFLLDNNETVSATVLDTSVTQVSLVAPASISLAPGFDTYDEDDDPVYGTDNITRPLNGRPSFKVVFGGPVVAGQLVQLYKNVGGTISAFGTYTITTEDAAAGYIMTPVSATTVLTWGTADGIHDITAVIQPSDASASSPPSPTLRIIYDWKGAIGYPTINSSTSQFIVNFTTLPTVPMSEVFYTPRNYSAYIENVNDWNEQYWIMDVVYDPVAKRLTGDLVDMNYTGMTPSAGTRYSIIYQENYPRTIAGNQWQNQYGDIYFDQFQVVAS